MFGGFPEGAGDAWCWNSDVPFSIEGSVSLKGPGLKCSAHSALPLPPCRSGSTANGASHLFRLFVGWVPPQFSEADLKPYFDQCGEVKDVIVLKDKVTGQPKSCAFVSYATEAEAERAIEMLDRKLQLPGATSPMEVRFARSHQYIQAGYGPEDNRQLFFSRAPLQAGVEDVREVFKQYGKVIDVNIFTDRKSSFSKGCGFVTMGSRLEAIAAMEGLNEKYIMKGALTSLSVKWADPELQAKKKKAVEEANADNRMLFFAKILRTAKEDEVKTVFAQYGSVHDVNLFRPFQGAPTTKGCGLVTMGSHSEAAAAISGLDGRFSWEGMDSAMVVKWMDAQLQKRRKEDHLAAMRQGLAGHGGLGPKICRVPGTTAVYSVPANPNTVTTPSQQGNARRLDCHEIPPLGCQDDAIKLFIGNVPKSFTAENLRPLFTSIGTVVELVVVRDKVTDESKGSAFVWYQTRQEAERAIAQLHLRPALQDPTGEQDRPLVVRRATPKMPLSALQIASAVVPPISDSSMDVPAHLQASFVPQTPSSESQIGLAALSKNHAPMPSLSSDLGNLSLSPNSSLGATSGNTASLSQAADALYGLTKGQSAVAPFLTQSSEGPMVRGASLGISDDKLETLANAVVSDAYAGMCSTTNLQSTTGTQAIPPFPSAGTLSAALPVTVQSTPLQQPSASSTVGLGQMTLALHVTPQQGAFLSSNLHSIQSSSGALVQLAPGAEGSFVVLLSGNERQVDAAKSLVHNLILRAM